MFISALKGVAPRRDDAAVMAGLSRCGMLPTENLAFYGLMNEMGDVYRLIICDSLAESTAIRQVLAGMGFTERSLRRTGYENLVSAGYWKP